MPCLSADAGKERTPAAYLLCVPVTRFRSSSRTCPPQPPPPAQEPQPGTGGGVGGGRAAACTDATSASKADEAQPCGHPWQGLDPHRRRLASRASCAPCSLHALASPPSPAYTHTHTSSHTHIHTHTHTHTLGPEGVMPGGVALIRFCAWQALALNLA